MISRGLTASFSKVSLSPESSCSLSIMQVLLAVRGRRICAASASSDLHSTNQAILHFVHVFHDLISEHRAAQVAHDLMHADHDAAFSVPSEGARLDTRINGRLLGALEQNRHMIPVEAHLVLNQVPLIGLLFSLVFFVAGLMRSSEQALRAGLRIFLAMGIAVLPVVGSGLVSHYSRGRPLARCTHAEQPSTGRYSHARGARRPWHALRCCAVHLDTEWGWRFRFASGTAVYSSPSWVSARMYGPRTSAERCGTPSSQATSLVQWNRLALDDSSPLRIREGRSYDRRSRVAADDFVQGRKDRVFGDIHFDSALKCRSNVNGRTLNSGTARNSASESAGTISDSNKATV